VGNRTALFSRNQPGGVFVIDDLAEHPGAVFFVGSTVTGALDAVGYGKNPDAPFATLKYAFSSDVLESGDTVYLLPGHTEVCIAAGTITCDIAGVHIVGLGEGAARPTFTFTTSAAASLLISAANITLENCVFDCTGIDALTKPLNISGADCKVNRCEFLLNDAAGQCTYGLVSTAGADRLVVEDCYFYSSTNDAGTAAAICIVGGESVRIVRNRIIGYFTTTLGGIENKTTAATNILIDGNTINNKTAASTNVIALHANTTGVISNNVMAILQGTTPITAAAAHWGGGNSYAAAVATAATIMGAAADTYTPFIGSDDADNAAATTLVVGNADGSVLERLENLEAEINGDVGIAAIRAAAAPANGISLAEIIRSIWANQCGTAANENGILTFPNAAVPANNVSLAEVVRSLWGGLWGTAAGENGIAAWPAAAAYANDISIAEVLAYIQDAVRPKVGATYLPGFGYQVVKTQAMGSDPDDLFDITGKVMITLLTGEVTTIIGGAATVQLVIKTSGEALCAATTIDTDIVGTMYLFTGDAGDVLNGGDTITAHIATHNAKGPFPIVVGLTGGACTIQADLDAADTGAIEWRLYYLPLDATGAVVAAA
jgi:hypothetical protein